MKVVCIGFSKTGTTSLEKALDILGFSVCNGHYKNNYSNYLMGLFANGDIERILTFMNGFDAFADAPWGGSDLYRHIERRFPDTRFILTTRNTDDWVESLKNMILDGDPNPETALASFYKSGAYGFCDYFRTVFERDSLVNGDEHLRSVYERFNNDALRHFAQRDEFLHFELDHASWPTLCTFLGKPVPSVDFPRLNVRQETRVETYLELTLDDAYQELAVRLAANDTKAVEKIVTALLQCDPQRFCALLRSLPDLRSRRAPL